MSVEFDFKIKLYLNVSVKVKSLKGGPQILVELSLVILNLDQFKKSMKADRLATFQNCSKSQGESSVGRDQNLPLSQRPSKQSSPTIEPTACHSAQLNRSLNRSAYVPHSPGEMNRMVFLPQTKASPFFTNRQYDLCVPEFSLWNRTGDRYPRAHVDHGLGFS